MPSLSSIVKLLDDPPNSVGSLSAWLQSYGHALPSTLSMGAKKVVWSLSDEIFALRAPIVVTIDAHSTAILKMQRASDRSAPTWKAPFEARDDHLFHSIGMASDRGMGLVAGYQAAGEEALGVRDQFHEFHDLFPSWLETGVIEGLVPERSDDASIQRYVWFRQIRYSG